MNLDRPQPERLLPLAGILTPIAAIALARVLLSAGPAEAPAAVPGMIDLSRTDAAIASGSASITDRQAAALEYLKTVERGPSLRSPMATPAPPPVQTDPGGLVTPLPQPEDPRESLTLTSVVGKGDRAIASISGRIYRVGDDLADGWQIATIDVAHRQVVLTNQDGRECVLSHHMKD